MRFSKLLVVFLLLVSVAKPINTKAQVMEVGVTAGLSYYIGDINPGLHFAQSDLGLGASLRYYKGSRWAFRFQYSNLNLSASDEKSSFRPERGLAFTDKVNDFAFLAEFNFFDYWTGSRRSYVTPYLFAGISVFTFEPLHPNGTPLQPIMTEGVEYALYSFSIPFGVGVKYSIGKRIGLTLEWRLHKTFTDYIDDIHGVYPEPEMVAGDYTYSDPTSNYQPGMQRGNGTAKSSFAFNCDWFNMLGLSFSYKFNLPQSDKCHAGMEENYFRYY